MLEPTVSVPEIRGFLNEIMMITFIQKLRAEGMPLDDAIIQGALTRLRPASWKRMQYACKWVTLLFC